MFGLDEQAGDILVPWIDAVDGSPLLDLKPYIPMSDRVREVEVAPWLQGWPDCMEDAATFDFAAAGLAEQSPPLQSPAIPCLSPLSSPDWRGAGGEVAFALALCLCPCF